MIFLRNCLVYDKNTDSLFFKITYNCDQLLYIQTQQLLNLILFHRKLPFSGGTSTETVRGMKTRCTPAARCFLGINGVRVVGFVYETASQGGKNPQCPNIKELGHI